MTLEHLNGKVFNADPVKQIAKGIPAAIGKRITTWETAFCPVCLKEHGTWLLNWHSRWNLICEAHGCELIESCPGCSKPPSALRRITWPTKKGEVEKDPTCCWWSIGGKLCRFDLKEIQVRPVDLEVLGAVGSTGARVRRPASLSFSDERLPSRSVARVTPALA